MNRYLFAIVDALPRDSSAGGKRSDIVTTTASITDDRYDRRFLDIREEFLGDDFPARATLFPGKRR